MGTPVQPFLPTPRHLIPQTAQRRVIARDPIVGIMASQLLTEGLMLLRHGLVGGVSGTTGLSASASVHNGPSPSYASPPSFPSEICPSSGSTPEPQSCAEPRLCPPPPGAPPET